MHITLPAPGGSGAVRAARRALAKAGLEAGAIDHLNAHATSTEEGDKAELMAIRTILGDRAPEVAVTANKSMLGHTLGAAGALEAISTIQTIRTGIVPPTINLTDPDELAEGLDLTPLTATRRDVRDRPQQLVRLRRPEHRPDLQPVRRMTDEPTAELPGEAPAEPAAEPAAVGSGLAGRTDRCWPGRSPGAAPRAQRADRARGRGRRDRPGPAQGGRAAA